MARDIKIGRCNGDLVGSAEAAEILGKPVSSITRWRKAGKMPEQVEELAATFVWLRVDIERMRDERQ